MLWENTRAVPDTVKIIFTLFLYLLLILASILIIYLKD